MNQFEDTNTVIVDIFYYKWYPIVVKLNFLTKKNLLADAFTLRSLCLGQTAFAVGLLTSILNRAVWLLAIKVAPLNL